MNISFWFDSIAPVAPQLPVVQPQFADIVIVGAGFTGLWTAYYLNQKEPSKKIVVLEAQHAGFGASGRNGGWCMGTAMGIDTLLARESTRTEGMRLARTMQATLDEIEQVCLAENIDCHFYRGGTLTMATTPFHGELLVQAEHQYVALGYDPQDHVYLDSAAARVRLNMTPNFGAMYTPHCARIQPALLARGLADVLQRRGVTLLEQTPVQRIEKGAVETRLGTLRAPVILRATEGYTDTIAGHKRQLLPLYSMMVATEPLPDNLWDEIGLQNNETFGDMRRIVIYGQRTADNRIAFGGRAGYFFNSGIKPVIARNDPAVKNVEATLRNLFPMIADYKVTHGWGGLMGAPRDWQPYVHFDHAQGFGAAGGYTGEGVGASNLAGRILSDLALHRETELTSLPWVGDLPRRWEPEPFRWMGAAAIQYLGDLADRYELRTGKPSKFWGGLFGRVL